jgi:hypothetical protein
VLLLGPDEERIYESLVSQMGALVRGTYFNSNAKFVIIVNEYLSDVQAFLLYSNNLLWDDARIENVLIVIEKYEPPQYDINGDIYGLVESKNFDIYSFFPYDGGRCGDNNQAVLVDQCYIENAGELSNDTYLFPNKFPDSFQGCLVTAVVLAAEPYAVEVNKSRSLDENGVFKFRGLDLEYLAHVTEILNLSAEIILGKEKSYNSTSVLRIQFAVQTGLYNNAVEATVPYLYDALKWYVPCPRSVVSTESIMGVFSFSVWLAALSVVLVMSLVFWFTAKSSYRSVVRESHSYRTLVRCMYDLWCVFMGVSVAEMPRTSRVRVVFFLFVCYSFVISTVFQSFFVSFLVSPSNLRSITTLEELLNSSLKYGNNPGIHGFLGRLEYDGIVNLPLDVFECPDRHRCLERLFTEGDIAVVSPAIEAQYVATRMDMEQGKVLCTLDEYLFPFNRAMYVTSGDPLLPRLNNIVVRCVEAGLVEKLWSEFIFVTRLRNAWKSNDMHCEVCSDDFVVFSLSHLKVAFLFLGFGYAVCTTVLLAEIFWKRCSATIQGRGTTPFPYIH